MVTIRKASLFLNKIVKSLWQKCCTASIFMPGDLAAAEPCERVRKPALHPVERFGGGVAAGGRAEGDPGAPGARHWGVGARQAGGAVGPGALRVQGAGVGGLRAEDLPRSDVLIRHHESAERGLVADGEIRGEGGVVDC